jgi:hypothetical protein
MVKDSVDSMQVAYRKYGQHIRINTSYEENGAILLTNRLLYRKGLIIQDGCSELVNQMQGWVVDGTERPADGHGLARSLCNMVSTLHEYGKMTKPPPPMANYSTKKTDWIAEAIKKSRESGSEPTTKSRYDCDW